MKQRIAHVKFTNCSWGPDDFTRCFNKYSTQYHATLIWKDDVDGIYPDIPSIHAPTDEEIIRVLNEGNFDFVHFHNDFVTINNSQLIHFHSPPNFYPTAIANYPRKKLIVGTVWALLPEYSKCEPVPPIIDIHHSVYNQVVNTNPKIKIGYSPSITCKLPKNKINPTGYHETSKGFEETSHILNQLVLHNKNVDIDIIHDVYITDCLKRKAQCDILLDEVVNRGYHKCSLEAMTLGKLTICSLDENVNDMTKKMMNIDGMPFHNIWLKNLESELQNIINKGKQYIHEDGARMRKFMEEHWNPKKVIEHYEKIYEKESK